VISNQNQELILSKVGDSLSYSIYDSSNFDLRLGADVGIDKGHIKFLHYVKPKEYTVEKIGIRPREWNNAPLKLGVITSSTDFASIQAAPTSGYSYGDSPLYLVQVEPNKAYFLEILDPDSGSKNYAKLKITSDSWISVKFDYSYQSEPDNPNLK